MPKSNTHVTAVPIFSPFVLFFSFYRQDSAKLYRLTILFEMGVFFSFLSHPHFLQGKGQMLNDVFLRFFFSPGKHIFAEKNIVKNGLMVVVSLFHYCEIVLFFFLLTPMTVFFKFIENYLV